MSLLLRFCSLRLTSFSFDRRLGQYVCFMGAPVLLTFGTKAICRFAVTPWEVAVGLLSSGSVALLLVVIGLLLPSESAPNNAG